MVVVPARNNRVPRARVMDKFALCLRHRVADAGR